MKRLLLCFLLATAVLNLRGAAQQSPPKTSNPKLATLRDLSRYVGTYPCENGLLEQSLLLQSLRKILGQDYKAYREHMSFSGCGAIERESGFLVLDVSQMHVGGYWSLIFVRESDGALFLFWLKSTVSDKDYEFYGERPIPPEVSRGVESRLNVAWGHVATFTVVGEQVNIDLKRR